MDDMVNLLRLFFLEYSRRRRNIIIRHFAMRKHYLNKMVVILMGQQIRQTVALNSAMFRKFYKVRTVSEMRGASARAKGALFFANICKPENADQFFETFRMSQTSFNVLLAKIKPFIAEPISMLTVPVPIEHQLAVCLYKLSSCSSYTEVGDLIGIHKSTVHKFFHQVLNAILRLRKEFISFPTSEEAWKAAEDFQTKCFLPNIFGCVHVMHICVRPRKFERTEYLNNKKWPSMILQCVVDNNCIFRAISIKSPGSTDNDTAFKESGLYKNAEKIIPRAFVEVADTQLPLVLSGDEAYPLLPWLVTPYAESFVPEEELFNKKLNLARNHTETAFTRLMGRWKYICNRVDVHVELVPDVVAACVILHNFLESRTEGVKDEWLENMAFDSQPQKYFHAECKNPTEGDALRIRDVMRDYAASSY